MPGLWAGVEGGIGVAIAALQVLAPDSLYAPGIAAIQFKAPRCQAEVAAWSA